MAEVTLTPTAEAQFEHLPRPIKARVLMIFERLEYWPSVAGAKPLRGKLAGHYRIRTGDYRVQFFIQAPAVVKEKQEPAETEPTVVVERIGHRKDIYE